MIDTKQVFAYNKRRTKKALMTSFRTGAWGLIMPKRDRERWRNKQKRKKEEALDRKTVAGVSDLTPYLAVENMRREGAR